MAPTTSPRLREAREAAGLTQQALAERVGTRQPHIARWEAGSSLPRVDAAVRVAAALGTTVEAIWIVGDNPTSEARGVGAPGPRDRHQEAPDGQQPAA